VFDNVKRNPNIKKIKPKRKKKETNQKFSHEKPTDECITLSLNFVQIEK
jgi:hypothetical protein